MILNLLPIPPLDGSKVLTSFLPREIAYKYNNLQKYGFYILLALILIPINGSNLLFFIMKPFINVSMNIIQAIVF
ncbi:peptidase M50 family protein [Francisella philomiragia]|uniref:Metallopeptidase, M50B family n=2 Tax=Francisella philomiragia TaxID=28110 RepID=B0TZN1_FRAP2|nr:peptidase M50 family protein [Francisella philomiragia]AJI48314.1 peptidase M50 family protein [Francisella philomiragia]